MDPNLKEKNCLSVDPREIMDCVRLLNEIIAEIDLQVSTQENRYLLVQSVLFNTKTLLCRTCYDQFQRSSQGFSIPTILSNGIIFKL